MLTTSWVSMPHPFRGVHYFGGGSVGCDNRQIPTWTSVSTRQNLTDEILYHLPRWSSPRKLDHFQGRSLVSETVLWAGCSVVNPPPFRRDQWFHALPILGYEFEHSLL